MPYLLRVAVKTLGVDPIAELEIGTAFDIGKIRVSLSKNGQYLVFKAGDFITETDARQFIPRLKAGLWNLALERNLAFVPDFSPRQIIRSADPNATGRNLAKSFGLQTIGPVHGLADEGGATIYPTDEEIRFIGLGEITAHVSIQLKNALPVIVDGIEKANVSVVSDDEKASTAFDLYLAHFNEKSLQARFLMLMMALEVLAPVTEKHAIVQEMIKRWKTETSKELRQTHDPEAVDALEAVERELEFRRETSIRRRVRRLVLDSASLDEETKKQLARQIVQAYDLRGTLVHTGTVDQAELAEAYATALHTLKLVMRSRLGLASAQAPSVILQQGLQRS